MTKAVPNDAQGESQGGISAIMNVAMLAGTVFFSQIFGGFMAPGGWQSPDVALFVAPGGMALSLLMHALIVPVEEKRL